MSDDTRDTYPAQYHPESEVPGIDTLRPPPNAPDIDMELQRVIEAAAYQAASALARRILEPIHNIANAQLEMAARMEKIEARCEVRHGH